ncbi:rhoGEF domain-containing protein [Naegleria gruberi]|uniref:RhoGEF domain-containing protein n=1 Tax=Naegleria gruberi TaxID=5762 RepID=D2V7H7_NAEGR|nr:rhoGEF domain-containing protein [Naegleria gruberi]EFC47381.1 rhoGEF domain-containing protein [Naegleria gruberi]|eukprot:XP_002680125.1 rhoGEF domain-containing protein [Naegleria gruberi strain NEG-M]
MSSTKQLPVPPPKPPRSSFITTTTTTPLVNNNSETITTNTVTDSPTIATTNNSRTTTTTSSSRSYTLRPNASPPTALINSLNNNKNTNSSPSSASSSPTTNNVAGGNNSPSSPGGSRKPPPPLPPRPTVRSKTIASVNSPSERSTGGVIQFASVVGGNNNLSGGGRSSVGGQVDDVTSGSSLSINVGKGISNNSNNSTSSFVKSTLNIGSKLFSNGKSKEKAQSPQVLTILHKIPPPKPTEPTTSSATTPVSTPTSEPKSEEKKDDENDIATKSTHAFKLDLDRVLTPTQEEPNNPPSSAHSEKLSTCDESDDEEEEEEEEGSIKSFNRSGKSAPPPIPQKKIKTAEEKEIERRELRWEVIAEISKTEENYVEGMNHLERFYIKPLRALGNATQVSGSKQIITQKDLSFIFDKMTVIKSVNEGFLKQWKTLDVTFETQDDTSKSIGLFFKRTMPMFKVYTDYVNNYNNIASKVKDMMKENPGFDSYMNEMERNARKQGKVGFFSYMIQPVQRLPRYTLLLNELLKHTPETHYDFKNINEALELSKQVSSHVNSAMNVVQNQMKMNEIDTTIGKLHENIGGSIIKPSRCFVMEGEDFLVSEIVLGRKIKKGDKRTLILLNDMVLIAKKGKYSCHINFKNEMNVEYFKYPWIYFDLDYDKQSFEIVTEDVTYLITCPTAIACNEWIDKLSQNTSCNAGPVKELRANKLVHTRVKKIFNEQNVYIIDFENSEYYMCYSQRDKVTIKIPKKDAVVRDIVPEDEITFGSLALDDDASCDDSKTTASSDTADTASSQMVDGNRMSRSTSISDLSTISEDGSSLKSPRSARGFNPLKALNMDLKIFNGKKQSPSNSKNNLSSEDKVKNIHSSLSEIASAGEMMPPSNRLSLQNDQHTKTSPFLNKNRQSLSAFEQANSGENSPANPEEFMGNQIARRTSDFQQTIEERKKTLIRREAPPIPQGNNTTATQQQKAPWLAELESKRMAKVSKQEEQ